MALTEGQICTVALGRVGEKQAVDNLNANTTSAKLCNAIYAMARDAALEEYPWPFATRRAVLALLADDEDDDESRATAGWAYTYGLPTDMLPGGQRYIETGLQNPAIDQQVPFVVEDDAENGPVLLTDQQNAELVYTRKTTETGKFTPLFTDALAWRIAYELCFSLPVKPQVAERMLQAYQMKVAQAAASSFRHQKEAPQAKPSGIRARY